MPLQNPISLLGVYGIQNTKTTFHLFTSQPIHKKCPPIQWQGQLLLRPEEYFPGELIGEEDCDGPGQERRITSNSHSSSKMEDNLLARSFCQSTSLQQLVKHCIYLMYLFQIQIFCLWFGLAGSSHSSRSCSETS